MSKLLVVGIEPVKEIHSCFAEFTYTPRSLPDDTTPMVGGGETRVLYDFVVALVIQL